MSQKTYAYKKIITTSTSEGVEGLPRLRNLTVFNNGAAAVKIECDNPIDSGSTSLTLNPNASFTYDFPVDKLYHVAASGTPELYLLGARQFQEDPS